MNQRDWHKTLVRPEMSLRDALQRMDEARFQIVMVADENNTLLGVLTDGNVRRAILRGIDLNQPVREVMSANPVSARPTMSREEMMALMRKHVIHQLPVVDENKRILKLVTLDDFLGLLEKPNWVVLMVGGLGQRLQPLTNDRPKPLLEINGKPILEIIIEAFAEQGFKKIFMAVNYKAEMIQEHFGNGDDRGLQIEYLLEEKRLGTAGALSLLPGRPEDPLIVMNGDLLTKLNFDRLIQFHDDHQAAATMAVRDYSHQIPYGVVDLSESYIRKIVEKPTHSYFVNAGIYALSPRALEEIPADTYFDMPQLMSRLSDRGDQVAAYPLREYWLDVGRIEEFRRAQREWRDI